MHLKKNMKQPGILEAHALDALDVEATKALIEKTGAQIVINVGQAFINMSVLSACLETGAAYMDTAIHEEPGQDLRDAALVFQLRVEAPRRVCREGV